MTAKKTLQKFYTTTERYAVTAVFLMALFCVLQSTTTDSMMTSVIAGILVWSTMLSFALESTGKTYRKIFIRR